MGANQVDFCEDCDGAKPRFCGWCGELLRVTWVGLDPEGNHCCDLDCPDSEACEEGYLAGK